MKKYILVALLAVSGSLRAMDGEDAPASESGSTSLFSVLGFGCVTDGMRAAFEVAATHPKVLASVRDLRELAGTLVNPEGSEDQQEEGAASADQSDNNRDVLNGDDSEVDALRAEVLRLKKQLADRKHTEDDVRAALNREH